MKYNELHTLGKRQPRQRRGRGIAAGRGKTAGRGTKGQGSRKSGGVRIGFEGGQMPLYMRLPKLRGFKSHHRRSITITTGQLQTLKAAIIDNQALVDGGLLPHTRNNVKVVAGGELKSAKSVKLHSASAGAKVVIEAAGGSFESARGETAKKSP